MLENQEYAQGAGIHVPKGVSLTIDGSGTMYMYKYSQGADIALALESDSLNETVTVEISVNGEAFNNIKGGVKLSFRLPASLNVPLGGAPDTSNIRTDLAAVLLGENVDSLIQKSLADGGTVYAILPGSDMPNAVKMSVCSFVIGHKRNFKFNSTA